jgi:hypothetical protein
MELDFKVSDLTSQVFQGSQIMANAQALGGRDF